MSLYRVRRQGQAGDRKNDVSGKLLPDQVPCEGPAPPRSLPWPSRMDNARWLSGGTLDWEGSTRCSALPITLLPPWAFCSVFPRLQGCDHPWLGFLSQVCSLHMHPLTPPIHTWVHAMPHPRPVPSSPGTSWNARASRSAHCLCASKTLAGTSLISASPSLLTLGTNSSLGAFSPHELQILLVGTEGQPRGPRPGLRFCLLPLALVFRMSPGQGVRALLLAEVEHHRQPSQPGVPRQLPSGPPIAMEEAVGTGKPDILPPPPQSCLPRRSRPLSLAN